MFLVAPSPNLEASDFIKSKPAVSKAVFDKLIPELKARAFTITGIQHADVLQRCRDLIATLPEGGDWEEIKEKLLTEITPYFVDETAEKEEQEKQLAAANRRAELLIRTHGQQAYAAAQYGMLAEQVELFPNWQYLTLGDDHVRPTHAALDGIVLPATHEFWKHHYPPWDWGCRCQIVPLSRTDTAAIQKQDAKKPADHQRVLNEFAQEDLSRTRRLVRNGVTYNVTAPAEEHRPGAYQFHPGDLRITPEQLAGRYDPDIWAQFQHWAKTQVLQDVVKEDGSLATVWEWMNGILPPSAPTAPEIVAWPHPDEVEVVDVLGGSTGAEKVKDPRTGRLYVRKRGNNPDHLREENTSDEMYRAFGVPVPESRLTETPNGPVKLAEFIAGQTLGKYLASATPAQRDAVFAQASKHFAVDALLGNWDVAGMGLDNMLVAKDGTLYRIDNGGALRFRAQGAAKGTAWNPHPTELWTLRDKAKNADAAQIFGGLDIFGIARQIEALDPAVLAGAPDAVRPMLEARLEQMRDVARKALDMEHDQWSPDYTDHLTRHIVGLRAGGVLQSIAPSVTQAPSQVLVKDANGLAWDHLRAHATASKAPASDIFYVPILNAAKTLNKHGTAGDFKFTEATVKSAMDLKPQLATLAHSPDAATAHAAAHYLSALDKVKQSADEAKKGAYVAVPQITQAPHYTAPAPVAARSIVQAFETYCQANGLSNAPASRWMASQGAHSWDNGACAYKAFIARQMQIPDSEIYWGSFGKAHCEQQYQKLLAPMGAHVEQSLIARHALVQETLARLDHRYNDRTRRVVRLVRTEPADVMRLYKVAKGPDRTMPRGCNESSSVFRTTTVFGSEVTVQAVPHSRITSLYYLERDGGGMHGSLAGDNENEFTFVPHRIPFDYVNSVAMDGDADATHWNLNLSHIRPTPTP